MLYYFSIYYIHQGYVFASVGLAVSRINQKVMDESP